MRLAWRGRRNLDAGTEEITGDDTLRAVRRQALRVQLGSLVFAALLTAAFIGMSG